MSRPQPKTKRIAKEANEADQQIRRSQRLQASRLRQSQPKARVRTRLAKKEKDQSQRQEIPPEEKKLEVEQMNLNCSICFQIFYMPTNTLCGHTYCLPCIQRIIRDSQKCSFCRRPACLSQLIPQPSIQRSVQKRIVSRQEERRGYQQRKAEIQAADARNKVSADDLKFGSRVDFWLNAEWRVGQVYVKKKNLVKLVYPLNHRLFQIEISLPSRLIAKHHAYTTRQLEENIGFDRALMPMRSSENQNDEEVRVLFPIIPEFPPRRRNRQRRFW